MPQTTFATPKAALDEQLRQEHLIRDVVLPAAQLDSAYRTMRRVVQTSPVDRGEYKLGWDVLVRKDEVRLVNDAPHAGVIELGARPFWPPIEPLIEWARRRAGALAMAGLINISSASFRVDQRGNLRYLGQAKLDPDDSAEVERFAYAVRAAIARRGLPPRYIMRNQLPFALKALDRAFKLHLRRVSEGTSRS